MKKGFFAVVFVIVLAFSLFSCKEKNNPTKTPEITSNEITFTDSLGRTVSTVRNPKRVACLLGSFAEIWMLSGGNVVATAEDAWEDFNLELDYDTINLGGAHTPNLELLISSTPDLVIASSESASNLEMLSTLEDANISVAYFKVSNFEEYLSMLDICTNITGRKDLYKKNGSDIKLEIEAAKKEFSKLNLEESKKKILLLRTSSTSVKAKGSAGTILGQMLCDLGCTNIADGNNSLLENLSIENIMTDQPYRIFVVTMGDDTDKAIQNVQNLIDENSTWKNLNAVKNNRIHFMDKKLFNIKPNSRYGEAYEKLAEIFKTD